MTIKREERGGPVMIPFFKIILFILLSVSFSSPAFPQIYKWKDKDGNIVFSDTLPSGADAKKVNVLKERETPTPKEQGIKPGEGTLKSHSPVAVQAKEKREYRDVEVILYMTEWCPYCRKAREYLKSLGVNLIEYDIEKDKSKNQEKLLKSGEKNGVPVIDVEGIIIYGFSPDQIKNAVEKRRNI